MNIHLTLSAAEQKGTVLAASPPLSQAAGPLAYASLFQQLRITHIY